MDTTAHGYEKHAGTRNPTNVEALSSRFAAFLCLTVAGCGAPRSLASNAASPEPRALLWYEWKGESWGADFVRTDLAACEIDFQRRVWRRIALAVERPHERLPRPGEELPWQLTKAPFEPIDEVQFTQLQEATRAWLATGPRATDDSWRSRGREDGLMERFTVVTDRGEFRVRVNPPDEMDDAPRPSLNRSYPAYRELRALLVPHLFFE